MAKHVSVMLYTDGGSILYHNDVEVDRYSADTIEFSKRTENEDGTVTAESYTSNLPYVIFESVTGPKNLL